VASFSDAKKEQTLSPIFSQTLLKAVFFKCRMAL